MKIKIIIQIIVQTVFLSALSAQITRKEADRIVIERVSREKPPYVIYETGSDLYDFWPGCMGLKTNRTKKNF